MSGMYAQDTSVSVERSKAEIERTLARYGAKEFAYATTEARAMVGFKINNRAVRIILPLPNKKDSRFWRTPAGRGRGSEYADKQWEQACRSSWRALHLVLKAKLEACASGISTIEREFLADILLPNGQTIGEWTQPQIETVYEGKDMPRLLPGAD